MLFDCIAIQIGLTRPAGCACRPLSHATDVDGRRPRSQGMLLAAPVVSLCREVTDRRPSTEVIDDDELGKRDEALGARGAREATSSPLASFCPRRAAVVSQPVSPGMRCTGGGDDDKRVLAQPPSDAMTNDVNFDR